MQKNPKKNMHAHTHTHTYNIYIYIYIAVHQKLTKHCKSTILNFFKLKF